MPNTSHLNEVGWIAEYTTWLFPSASKSKTREILEKVQSLDKEARIPFLNKLYTQLKGHKRYLTVLRTKLSATEKENNDTLFLHLGREHYQQLIDNI